jgi:peptidyl-prolyl cis-trans isomerase D
MPVGGTSGIVRSEFGFHIIRVTDRRDASTRPLAEVHDSIQRQLEFSRGQEKLAETVRSFREEISADPGAFDRAASELGLPVEDTGLLARDGAVAAIGDAPQVARAVFQIDIGEASPPVTVPQGTLFLRTVEILPPLRLPFEEARALVEADHTKSESLARARTRVLEALQPGTDLASLASSLGATTSSATSFSRHQALEPFDPVARDLAFSLAVNQVSEPIEVEGGLLVFEVTERQGFDPIEFEDLRDSLTRSMLQQRRDRLFSAVLSGLESSSEIQVNHARMDLIEGRGA